MKKATNDVYVLVAGKWIMPFWPGQFNRCLDRYTLTVVPKELWDRAEKYGFIRYQVRH